MTFVLLSEQRMLVISTPTTALAVSVKTDEACIFITPKYCVYAIKLYNYPMISNRIALYRVERGLSRKDLAAAVGVNPQTVGFLERGSYTPSVELALKLAASFNVPVEALFSLKPFPALAVQLQSADHPTKE